MLDGIRVAYFTLKYFTYLTFTLRYLTLDTNLYWSSAFLSIGTWGFGGTRGGDYLMLFHTLRYLRYLAPKNPPPCPVAFHLAKVPNKVLYLL